MPPEAPHPQTTDIVHHQTRRTKMVTTLMLTYRDYANIEGSKRYEILDGELILAPSPNMTHHEVVANLETSLSTLGRVYFAPTDVVFTDSDVLQPDVLFITKERQDIRTPSNIQGALIWSLRSCRPRHPAGTGATGASCTRVMRSHTLSRRPTRPSSWYSRVSAST